jgi:hypothetical protein
MTTLDAPLEMLNEIALVSANAKAIENEINWFNNVLSSGKSGSQTVPPRIENADISYAQFVLKHNLSPEERFVLILALIPHIRPDFLDTFFQRNPESNRFLTEMGGRSGKHHSGFLPTGETAIYLLGGKSMEDRIQAMQLFDRDHIFFKENILQLSDVEPGEPKLSGILTINEDIISHLTLGKKLSPQFNKNFPAKLLTTGMEWSDLVLNTTTREHLREIETWLEFNHVLMNGWGLKKVIKPGYKALFHGPPGTGKSLTAALLGKKTGREVYRIDLSMVVSKYIGETEKNLAGIFDRAENKNWILFFDEADALFGKRTSVSSSHDKYANQEVSYLLQRIEDFNGLVVLASNLKSNIDDAFSRRFNSIIYYPLPKQEERYQLWKNSFSESTLLEPEIRLEELAQKYELSGGHIVNVVHYCSLMAASRNETIIRMEDILVGVRKEFSKVGRTI